MDKLWFWSSPDIWDDFTRIVEQDVLPKLRAIRTLDDYYQYALPKDERELAYAWGVRLLFSIALGRLDDARSIMHEDLAAKSSAEIFNKRVPGLGDRLKAEGSMISREDRETFVGLLHKWEAYAVEKTKLGGVWERMPFPLEQQ